MKYTSTTKSRAEVSRTKFLIPALLLLGSFCFLATQQAFATTYIVPTDCVDFADSGGNPGGLDVYRCPATGTLAEGDVVEFAWGLELTGTGDSFSGYGSLTVADLTGESASITWAIVNDTAEGDIENAAIVSFGWSIDDADGDPIQNLAIDAATTSGTLLDQETLNTGGNTAIPGFADLVDSCVFFNNCKGGNINDGINIGESDGGTVVFTGDFTNGLSLDSFAAKWQTARGSFELPGGGGPPPSAPPIPEPAPLALVALGGILLGWMTRKKRA